MADIVRAIGEVVGAVREGPDVNRPRGVVYAKCVLKYSLSGAWAFGTAYILGKYNADPQQMINIFQKIALPAGVILMGMSTGCLKLSLQADSLSSLKELWKRYTKGILRSDLRQALLTTDLLDFAEAGQNVEVEVQIDERIYQEACLDLMVKTVLQDKQNDRNASLLYRRSLSESNIAVYRIDKELFLQAKPRDLKQEKQPTKNVIDDPILSLTTITYTNVRFLNIDDGKVFEKVQKQLSGQAQQRISNGTVEMLASSTSQISGIKVWVFREAEAAKLCGDKQGRQELPVKMGKQDMYESHFSVNLDDVYNGPEGPFYTLSDVDPNKRNQFQLSTMLYFTDGTVSEEFFSKPFHVRKMKKRTRTHETTISKSVSSLNFSPELTTGHFRVHTLVSDRVVASNVIAGSILNHTSKEFDFIKSLEKGLAARSPTQHICADFVESENLFASQIVVSKISTNYPTSTRKSENTQGPEVDRLKGTIFEFQTRKRAKTEKSTAGGDSGYGGELTSHITANTIEVERLIVNHLTTDVIQAPNA